MLPFSTSTYLKQGLILTLCFLWGIMLWGCSVGGGEKGLYPGFLELSLSPQHPIINKPLTLTVKGRNINGINLSFDKCKDLSKISNTYDTAVYTCTPTATDAHNLKMVVDGITIFDNKLYVFSPGWQKIATVNGSQLETFFYVDSKTSWIVGSEKAVVKVTDGFSNLSLDPSKPLPADTKYEAVYFTDANHGCVGGNKGIQCTSNGGSTWHSTPSTISVYAIQFADANTGWAVGKGGLILKTTNAGSNWQSQQTTPPSSNSHYAINFINTNTGWVIGGINGVNTIWKTTNGGENWNALTLDNDFPQIDDGGIFTDIKFVDENHGWVTRTGGTDSNKGGYIFNTTDGGQTWSLQHRMTNEVNLWSISFIDTKNGWVSGGIPGTILRTKDGGLTWTEQKSNSVNFIGSVFFVSPDLGYAVTYGGEVLATFNGGEQE